MASQKLIKEELFPVVGAYEQQLQKQQDWVSRFKWISPAIIAQESLNRMAGTSTKDYENFRKQVVGFAATWREHFMPFLYNNQVFSQEDYPDLPKFDYTSTKKTSEGSLIIILAISILVYLLGAFVYRKQTKNNLLTTS